MLRQRLLVAAVGLPLLALLLAVPERLFAIAVVVLLAYAAFELVHAAVPQAALTRSVSAAAAAALFLAAVRASGDAHLGWLLGVTAVTLALLLWARSRLGESAAGWWLGATLYAAVPGAHALLMRNLVDGREWLVVLFVVTFATDTGAYAVGRLLGRHLLAPSISPQKTFEGAAGGMIAGAAAGLGVPALLGLAPGLPWLALIALALPPAAMAGDLLESALKRRIGVKDMSRLLPGHGGLLDRIDSLLLVAPCLYWIVRWLET